MNLELTHDEAQQLRELLQDYLPELKRETARTDVKTLRHELALRQELVERLVARLRDGRSSESRQMTSD